MRSRDMLDNARLTIVWVDCHLNSIRPEMSLSLVFACAGSYSFRIQLLHVDHSTQYTVHSTRYTVHGTRIMIGTPNSVCLLCVFVYVCS